jgi:hypothetical protein
MAKFINKDTVRDYIQKNGKEVCNANLVALEHMVFGIILTWIRNSETKALRNLSHKMLATIAKKGRNWEKLLACEKVCFVPSCSRYEKERRRK